MQTDLEAFRRAAANGNVAPVWKTLTADLETPVSAYLKLAEGERYSFLLESVEGGERIGRYTYIGRDPFLTVKAWGTRIELDEGGAKTEREGNMFEVLRELTQRYKPAGQEGLPPLSAGAVGYIGYDLVRQIEPRVPAFRERDVDAPDAIFMFFSSLVVFDHVKHEVCLVANVRIHEYEDVDDGFNAAQRAIERMEHALARPVQLPPSTKYVEPVEATSDVGKEAYCRAVEKAKEYILAGDVFQVVLAHRLTFEPKVNPFQIYRALRAVNPSPYLFYLSLDDTTLVGSSPELLVKVEGRDIEYRPIAGTRPRGKDEAEDQALADELAADEKERAEHVMLVDLGRNDVGRVCEFGSVQVPEFMIIERYSHVMHIVSGIRGKLREDKDAFDALMACFPAGTLTGAPKVRAMEIIGELEPTARSHYAGCVMYLDFSGNLNSCIAIRTMLIKDGKAYLPAGAGIVADSVPEKEWEESMNKARGLLRAVERAREL
jgi:anthranilate synthase component 1